MTYGVHHSFCDVIEPPRRPSSNNSHPNKANFKILIDHFETWHFEWRFVFSNLENPRVLIFTYRLALLDPTFWIWKFHWRFVISVLENLRLKFFILIKRMLTFLSAILYLLFRISKFWVEIHNQRPQKPASTDFHPNKANFYVSTRHIEFANLNFEILSGFVISDLDKPRVPIFVLIKLIFTLWWSAIVIPRFLKVQMYLNLNHFHTCSARTARFGLLYRNILFSPMDGVPTRYRNIFDVKITVCYEKTIFVVVFFEAAILNSRIDETRFWRRIGKEHTRK